MSRTVSQTSQSGVTEKSRRFIETWARRSSSIQNPLAWTFGRPAARLADAAGDPLGELDVLGGEVDVVGDEERARADRDRAGRRVHPGRTEVRLAAALVDLGLQPLVLAAPDVGELHPLGSRGRLRIEVDREVEAGRDPLAERPGERDAIVHRRVGRGGRTG